MKQRYTRDFLDGLKDRVTLSAVIGQSIKLKPAGHEFKGLSPFQEEETPSFTVSDRKQFYHCFSTGRHGDVFKWLMEHDGLSFDEAIAWVCDHTGTPRPSGTSDERADEHSRLLFACATASQFFHSQLLDSEGEKARAYLADRGVLGAGIERFGLGWAPASSAGLLAALRRAGIGKDCARSAGLVVGADPGVALFRARIMIPVRSANGKVVGFGGRRMDQGTGPKYLNSPDTAIFNKGKAFFNLDAARSAAVKAGRLIVVEGYFDAISMVLDGFPETVAALGTAARLKVLFEYFGQVREKILMFDQDRAGRNASNRLIDDALPLAGPDNVTRFAAVPGASDPDQCLRQPGGNGRIREALAQATYLDEALWLRALGKMRGRNPPEAIAAFVRELKIGADLICDAQTREWFHTLLADRVEREFGRPRRLEDLLVSST